MDTNTSFEISIGHLCTLVLLDTGTTPFDLWLAIDMLVRDKKLYLPIDELIKRYTDITKEDIQLSKNNYQKYKKKKTEELEKANCVELVTTLDTEKFKNSKQKNKSEMSFLVCNEGYNKFDANLYTIKPNELANNDYDIFFVYQIKFTNLRDIDNFLEYYLEKGFENNIQKFKRFLLLCFRKHKNICTNECIETVNDWINSKNKIPLGNNSETKNGLESINESEPFESIINTPPMQRDVNSMFQENNGIKIPENPYPMIFKNGYALQMFLELKALTVKDKTVVADYGFIFHKMKDKNINAINSLVTEPVFIEFLNTTFQTDIHSIKLPFRNPDFKRPLYTTVLKKYKDDILK